MKFQDHFSGHAALYAEFRPHYPSAFFEYLASLAPARTQAWDCATGSGQAAIGLSECFENVIATDASARQLENATRKAKITYRLAPAEASGLEKSSVDLVVVAQALHWFDLARFFAEVKRVLRPGGVIAVSAYTLLRISPEIDRSINRFYAETTGPFWPPERRLVDRGYRDIDFPFTEISPPSFQMEERWTFDQLLGYLRTWSATQRFLRERGFDPVTELATELRPCWGEPNKARVVHWPLHLRIGRVP